MGWPRSTGAVGRQDVTDDLTRRLAEQILRGVKELHEEHHPSEPLIPGTPVAPHAAAERIGINLVVRWYAALEYRKSAIGVETEPAYGDVVGEP